MKPTAYADELRSTLSHINRWKNTSEKFIAQGEAVSNFISQSYESEQSLEETTECLQRLYSEDLLISKEVFAKAQQLAENEWSKCKSRFSNTPALSSTQCSEVELLFCKDTIYHAGVCCQAVCDYSAGDYQKFFKNKQLVPGHAFKAVSFSRSKKETFLIAQQGESTYYFAFKGRPCLSDWTKGYKSFSEGKVCCNILSVSDVSVMNVIRYNGSVLNVSNPLHC